MIVALALERLAPAEIVEACLAYHAAAGVGLVLAPEPDDAALADVLAQHEARGLVRSVSAGDSPARAAAVSGAGWLMRGRADEFWWPRGAPLDELLRAVPRQVGAVQALARRFVVSPGSGPFFERATLRCVPSAPALDPRSPERPPPRRICRLGDAAGEPALRAWFPVEVLCFAADPELDPCVGGTLVEDTRLRDALGTVAAGVPLTFPRPGAADDPDFAVEVAGLVEAEVVTAAQRIDELERRLAGLEAARLRPRLGRAVRRIADVATRRGAAR